MSAPSMPHRCLLAIGLAAFAVTAALPAPAGAMSRAERISQLQRAAADPGFTSWQRDFYRARLERERGAAPAPQQLAAPAAGTGIPNPLWTPIAETPRRMGHTLVIDSLTDRAVVFGGSSDGTTLSNDVFVIPLTGTRTWRKLAVSGPAPSARWGHVAVLDSPHRRMLVYAGADEDGSYLADLWALSLDGTPTWTQLTPAGTAPAARTNHDAVVDTLGNRMLVFGGVNGGFSPLADLWALSLDDSPTWTPVVPTGPAPSGLTLGGMFVDALRHRLWLCGVQTVNYSTSIVFYWFALNSPAPAWTLMPVSYSYPSPSSYGLACYLDAVGDRFVCFSTDGYGGLSYTLPIGGSWAAWTQWTWSTASQPTQLNGSAWAPDPARRRLLMCGGGPGSYSGGRVNSDLWSYDLASLTQWTPLAGEPAPRYGHAMAVDAAHGRMLLFGGFADTTGSGYSSTPTSQLWALGTDAQPGWSLLPATGGPLLPRGGAALVVDPGANRMLLFGGSNGSGYTNELWQRSLAGTAWNLANVAGTLPHQRMWPATVYDPVGQRLLVFGGYDGSSNGLGYLDDLWALSLTGPLAWSKIVPQGPAPFGREGAVLVYDAADTCAYLVGGWNNSYSYYSTTTVRAGEVWRLSLAGTPRWQQLARGLDSAIYASDESNCGAFYDDVFRTIVRAAYRYSSGVPVVSVLAPVSDTSWTVLPTAGVPPAASSDARAVYEPSSRRLLWFGGTNTGSIGTWALTFGGAPLAVPDGPARLDEAMRASPNPASARVTLRFALPRPGRVQLEVLDLAGRRVRGPLSAAFAAGPAELTVEDVGALPAGVYFARLRGAIQRQARIAIVH